MISRTFEILEWWWCICFCFLYGHYRLLWSKLRAEPRPEENRLAHMKKPAASRNK